MLGTDEPPGLVRVRRIDQRQHAEPRQRQHADPRQRPAADPQPPAAAPRQPAPDADVSDDIGAGEPGAGFAASPLGQAPPGYVLGEGAPAGDPRGEPWPTGPGRVRVDVTFVAADGTPEAGPAAAGAESAAAGAESVEDEIYLALRIADAAEVAVRVYARQLRDRRDRTRFEQEALALKALIGDPNVVAIDEIGITSGGHAYVIMEYCRSGSLQDHLTTVGRFTPTEVRRIGAKLAGALGAAHRRDVVHRNIKPSNVLVNAVGEPVLTDFGFVTLATVDGDFTPPSRPAAQPYAAPEAYLPELMSAASDIYSLGATLYALLAGWAPRTMDPFAPAIDGDTLVDLPRVPWALMSVIRVAMAHDPRDRFVDAFEMHAALVQANAG